MKQNLLKCLPLAAALLVGAAAQAQDTTAVKISNPNSLSTWSIGLNAGVLTPISPLGGKNDFSNWKANLGYGFYIKKQITPYFSLRLDAVGGKLSGDNSEPFDGGSTISSPVNAFETQLTYSGSLNAVVNLFNIDMFKKENAVQLYASAGAGLAGYKVETGSTSGALTDYAGGKSISELIIPVGLGVKFKLSDKINFDLGGTVNFVDGDNLDGVYRNGNDKYTYGYAGLEFALGKGEKQLAWHNPVALTYDEAVAAKRAAEALQSDLDAQKVDNAKLRTELNDLLKDTDGDGVADKLDKCPGTPAGTVVDGAGCPLKVPAPIIKESVIITESDRKVVADAIKNLEFDLGKATIRAKSNASLNRVAALLVEKNFSLKLAGHTDDTGSDELNMRLSKDRAESVKAYLVFQGANPSRIEATGYGETQPIATNKTAVGRQKNRRVEFTLY
ncbi:OmpA family protein [Pedobacter metabolipauper]|uniref:OOP family OmpA-OmpF porin n=1 Tax=Pedobacter metabolipauper TaxID=425513 RepID=A0A4R6SW52_9SPHI|nr:OmpA family protein [Pedobacter metabolipauper]TDQ10158.1 OOP family OmpA-OmpF porin [Pedobacter metabolipauper]